MAVSNYQEISVLTGVTSPSIPVDTPNSSLGVQVFAAGTAKLQYSLYANPGTDKWIDWIHGTIAGTKCVDLGPSVRFVRLVSVSGAASMAISSRAI
jgi:hypothetical protein